ncbi:UDP-N-acetylmuramoyl-tripeptide--D-alanyl-D-alanine ligase [Homoserinibacter sp. YIM 151385]|uniref:UDP-N-acetylmuramoyl-tripeptide--D-alanyl-D- alanine ligase n=1 Tax=Homoserinibacter sp. YIM 151385 TaxID=2985506 RepID=UPI0022F0D496|nr:UDP-N-acetylmuramoyl-tripeptide--D-alanyl-D-alanine ligase [Homoserinibacter sp. YIM 151385]WBU38743.1 UDP-N-acetylmuramoyl-tripeptide--D-alanyl-D-alanine ligase [Homoserinibacter sp. YIM 151385]
MIALRLGELARVVGGELSAGADPELLVDGSVETDSREVGPGSIFVAYRGEALDGADYAAEAARAGAALVVAERPLELPVPVVVVDSGVAALQALARHVVAEVRALGGLRVVGITGSNGKTTTKNLLREILGAEGPTIAPRGSFNNHVGAPISMLRIDRETRFLVVEMGASSEGDIARLVDIATPDVSVVLKVGLAHAGEFGGIEVTQRAKSEIVRTLPAAAAAILNLDDPRVAAMRELTAARVIGFGLGPDAEVRAEDVRASAEGTAFCLRIGEASHEVRLRILGEHHVYNALAALAVARELGVPLARAIPALEGVARAERWRMEVLERADGVTIINDAYNASPDSTAAAVKALAQVAGERRTVAVLGEMTELGEVADEEHDRIGRLAVRLDIRQLVVVGHGARHIHNAAGLEGSWDGESILVEDADAAYDVLRGLLRSGDVVLVKSSNSAGLRFLGDRLGEASA